MGEDGQVYDERPYNINQQRQAGMYQNNRAPQGYPRNQNRQQYYYEQQPYNSINQAYPPQNASKQY